MSRWLLAVFAAAGALSAPSTAPAARPTPVPTPVDPADLYAGTFSAQCSLPLIGIRPAAVTVTLDPPRHTRPSAFATVPAELTWSIRDIGARLADVPGLSTLDGTAIQRAELAPDGSSADVSAAIPRTPLGSPPADPLVLTGGGSAEVALTETGPAQLRVGSTFDLNLIARTAQGTPIVLPPAPVDGSGEPASDSDGNPDTFDVRCTLDELADPDDALIEPFWVGDTDGPADFQAPSVPGEMVPDDSERGANWAIVRWIPSTDNRGGSGLRGYAVVIDGVVHELDPDESYYELRGLTGDTDVRVYAIDHAGNMSDPLTVTASPRVAGAVRATPTPTPAPPAATDGSVVYACKYPLVGTRYVALKARVAAPATSPLVGATIDPLPFTADVDLYGLAPFTAGEAPATFGATLTAGVVAQSGQSELGEPVAASARITGRAFPQVGAAKFSATAAGTAGPITVADPGRTSLQADRIALNMRWTYADGTPYVLPPLTLDDTGDRVHDSDGDPNTFDVYCRQATGSGPYEIGAFDVTDPSATPTATPMPERTFLLQGSTTLPTIAKGSVPLTGGFAGVQFDATTGALTAGALTFNDTQGRLLLNQSGMPVTATIGFIPSGPPTGSLVAGKLTLESRIRVKVKSIKAFGAIPLAGGNNCQTKQLTTLHLESTAAFDPAAPAGGTLAQSAYAISDLNGCEPFGTAVDPATASTSNSITLSITP